MRLEEKAKIMHDKRPREDQRDWKHWTSKRDIELLKESKSKGIEHERRSPSVSAAHSLRSHQQLKPKMQTIGRLK
ncbi:Uncharacterized protein HZ326_22509 [Fusarium oxysporum f. sp. albedinis]|nr:Uncharacterized protein HZ326_22509 [Fusarium oxysporum f. sp. albedinis]